MPSFGKQFRTVHGKAVQGLPVFWWKKLFH